MNSTDTLIDQLASRADPVRHLSSPLRRSLLWLVSAFGIVVVVIASHGLRPGLIEDLSVPTRLVEWLASIATGIAAAYAAFQISVPGRANAWFWLPMPFFTLWLGTLCWTCVVEYRAMGSAALVYESASWECAAAITAMSLPLGLVMLLMVRHAGVVSAARTATLAALSAASLSASGVTLFHSGENALMVLLWHSGAVTLLCLSSRLLGRRMFDWIGHAKG